MYLGRKSHPVFLQPIHAYVQVINTKLFEKIVSPRSYWAYHGAKNDQRIKYKVKNMILAAEKNLGMLQYHTQAMNSHVESKV